MRKDTKIEGEGEIPYGKTNTKDCYTKEAFSFSIDTLKILLIHARVYICIIYLYKGEGRDDELHL